MNNWKTKIGRISKFAIFAIIVAITSQVAHASPNTTLYLIDSNSGSASNVADGTNFSISAMVNPGTNHVSAVSLHITYDQTKMTLSSITPSTTFSLVLQTANINNTNGTASIDLGIPTTNPSITSISTMASFSFHALAAGANSPIAYTSASQAAADSETGNVVTGTTPYLITIFDPAATPTASPAAGTYTSAQSITLSSATSGANIYYTTDGSTPTTSSTLYSGPFSVSATTTVKAIASKSGMSNSGVFSATYTMAPKVATPVASPAPGVYVSPTVITLTSTTPGATIYYTTDGYTPTRSATQYSGPISLSSTSILSAIAVKSGMTDSDVASGNYTLAVAIPVANIHGGIYNSPTTVSLTDSTPGATIFYTTDGSYPSSASNCYTITGPITVSANETIQAVGIISGMASMGIMTENYSIKAAKPTTSVSADTYSTTQSISLSSTTSGASIYYTTNGTVPTILSTLYSSPISVAATTTISAIAVKAGMNNSDVMTSTYVIAPFYVGVFTNGSWYLDKSANGIWDGNAIDANIPNFGLGLPNAQAVVGDWNGDGKKEIGVFSNGSWYLDKNGNGQWDGTPTDIYIPNFGAGLPGAQAVVGDWNGSGTTKVGIFYNGSWYLDKNGNGVWDGTPTDIYIPNFGAGLPGAQAVVGDWNGNGTTKVGVFYNGSWYLDKNGNGVWDGPSFDTYVPNFGVGLVGAKAVVGDWNKSGISKIGLFANGSWYLDKNGNGVWDGTPTDTNFATFGVGLSNAIPVVMK